MTKEKQISVDEINASNFRDLLGTSVILLVRFPFGKACLRDTIQYEDWYPTFTFREILGIYKTGGDQKMKMLEDLYELKKVFPLAVAEGASIKCQ